MIRYELVEIQTPKRYLLKGLYFSNPQGKTTVIYIHGLGGSVFGSTYLINPLAKELSKAGINLLAVNNRGHDDVSKIKKIDRRKRKGLRSFQAGAAHEIFTECADDLQGMVNYAKNRGAQKIFLVGHSTGCQKSIYYLSKKGKQKQVKGVVLLCPVSDYADAIKHLEEKLKTGAKLARRLIAQGRADQLLSPHAWERHVDAQRFLSLYTPNSEEEIFCYATPGQRPIIFQKVKIPILAVLAEKDQYRDRPTKQLVAWFERQTTSKNFTSLIIPEADHQFTGQETTVVKKLTRWIRNLGRLSETSSEAS